MEHKDFLILFNLAALIFNIGIGGYLYRQRKDDLRNLYFLAVTTCLGFLALFALKSLIVPAESSFLWMTMVLFPALFLPAFIFNLLAVQQEKYRNNPHTIHAWINFIPLLLSMFLLQDLPWIISSTHLVYHQGMFLFTLAVPVIFPLLLYIIYFILGFLPLHLYPEQGSFSRSFTASFLIPAILVLFIQLLTPHNPQLLGQSFSFAFQPWLIPAFALLSGILVSGTVIRHRTINLQVIASRTLIYSVVTLILSSLYVIVENLLESFFAGIIAGGSKFYEIIAALIIASFFGQIHQKITYVVEEIINFMHVESESELPKQSKDGLLSAFAIFIIVYFGILLTGGMKLPIPPRISYVISSAFFVATMINLSYHLYQLPFHVALYSLSLIPVVIVYVVIVTLVTSTSVFHAYLNVISLLLLILTAFFAGRLIAQRIDEQEWLIPLLVVGSLLDIWSVTRGVTSKMIETGTPLLNYLLVRYPSFHRDGVSQFVGVADLLFIVLLLGSVIQFKFPLGRNILFLNIGFVTTFITVSITGVGIPALPFLSIFFYIANRKILTVRKEDLFTACFVMAGALGVMYLVLSLRTLL